MPILEHVEVALIEIGDDALLVVDDRGMEHDFFHLLAENEDAAVGGILRILSGFRRNIRRSVRRNIRRSIRKNARRVARRPIRSGALPRRRWHGCPAGRGWRRRWRIRGRW